MSCVAVSSAEIPNQNFSFNVALLNHFNFVQPRVIDYYYNTKYRKY